MTDLGECPELDDEAVADIRAARVAADLNTEAMEALHAEIAELQHFLENDQAVIAQLLRDKRDLQQQLNDMDASLLHRTQVELIESRKACADLAAEVRVLQARPTVVPSVLTWRKPWWRR